MPAPPGILAAAPQRPAPPAAGTPAALLDHAARFGAYVHELEAQLAAWRKWAGLDETGQ